MATPDTHVIKHRLHHAIDVQIDVHVQQPKNGRRLTPKIVRQAILYRAQEGEDAPGFTCRIIQWRHGTQAWITPADEEQAWLNFRRFLQFGTVHINSRLR